MTLWKAKRIFIAADISAGILFFALIGFAGLLPGQYVDAVQQPEKKDFAEAQKRNSNRQEYSEAAFIKTISAEWAEKANKKSGGKTALQKNELVENKSSTSDSNNISKSLKCNGTIVSADPAKSLAAVAWEREEEFWYHPGELVEKSGGVEIVGIHYDYIEVKKKNTVVKIEIAESKPGGNSKSSRRNNTRRGSSRTNRREERRPGNPFHNSARDIGNNRESFNKESNIGKGNIATTKYGPNKYSIAKKDIEPYLKSPERLFTEMSVKPQIQNGEPTGGYIITGMKKNALLRQVGLRDGDVILRVNGMSPINLMSVLSKSSITEFNVEYLRAGRRQTLHYAIRD